MAVAYELGEAGVIGTYLTTILLSILQGHFITNW